MHVSTAESLFFFVFMRVCFEYQGTEGWTGGVAWNRRRANRSEWKMEKVVLESNWMKKTANYLWIGTVFKCKDELERERGGSEGMSLP